MPRMTTDLRVALTVWLNAFQAARKVDQNSNDRVRLVELPGVIDALAKASTALEDVADREVEAADRERERFACSTRFRAEERGDTNSAHPAIVENNRGSAVFSAVTETGVAGCVAPQQVSGLLRALLTWGAAYQTVLDNEEARPADFDALDKAELSLRRILSHAKESAAHRGLTTSQSQPPTAAILADMTDVSA